MFGAGIFAETRTRDFWFFFCFDLTVPAANVALRRLDGIFGRIFLDTDFLDTDFLHGFLDGFLDGFCDAELDGVCDDELGTKLLWAFHSIFLFFWPFPESTPKLHLGMVAGWQINESTLRA